MTTSKIRAKRWMFLLAGFLIFNMAYAQQQNMFGFKGGKAELRNVMMHYFAGGQITERPDKMIGFGSFDSDRLFRSGFPKLHFYIYESVRFNGNSFMVSNAGTAERPITANVIERQKGESWGKLVLANDFLEPIEAEYLYNEQTKILQLKFTLSDKDSEEYWEEADKMLKAGLLNELMEYEKTKSGIYTVSVEYLIK